jgi:hypothetical protein
VIAIGKQFCKESDRFFKLFVKLRQLGDSRCPNTAGKAARWNRQNIPEHLFCRRTDQRISVVRYLKSEYEPSCPATIKIPQ